MYKRQTQEELEQQIDRAVKGFSALDGVNEELANMLVGEGYLSYDDLEVIEPEFLMGLGNITEEEVDKIVAQAEIKAEQAEVIAQQEAVLRKQRVAAEAAAAEQAAAAEAAAAKAAEAAAKAEEESKASTEATADSETTVESESSESEPKAPEIVDQPVGEADGATKS